MPQSIEQKIAEFDEKFTHNGCGEFWQEDGLGYETTPEEVKDFLRQALESQMLEIEKTIKEEIQNYKDLGRVTKFQDLDEKCLQKVQALESLLSRLQVKENI